MQSFSIQEPYVKDFMQHLFTYDTFINFEVRGVTLHSFTYFEISGEKQDATYCNWDELRPYVRSILKGQDKPRLMKIIFSYAAPQTLHPNAATLFINLAYESTPEGDKITGTTANSQKDFQLNKEVDITWDNWVLDFFKQKGMESYVQFS